MKRSEINSLHRSLEKAIKDVLEFAKLEIKQPLGSGDWERAAVGTDIAFELKYIGTYQEEIAQRNMGGKCSVFALHREGASNEPRGRYWVGWFERWRVIARQDLALCTACWSVFAGPTSQSKQQIIRAEWDQLPFTGRTQSGQPHWHVDRFPRFEAGAYDTTAVAAPAQASLVLANAVDGISQLAGLHLAMGAWNGKEDHPMCWQRLAGKTDDLFTWGMRTLEYLKSELPCQS